MTSNFFSDNTQPYTIAALRNNLNDTWLTSVVEIQDKHAKQLAEKLAARLQRCETERQWSDVAFALGLLQHKNEDITKVVSEGFKQAIQAAA